MNTYPQFRQLIALFVCHNYVFSRRKAGRLWRLKFLRQNKIGKITASVTFELNQLERLNEIANRAGVSRSTIVRDAIERKLQRYEGSFPPHKVDPTPLEVLSKGGEALPPGQLPVDDDEDYCGSQSQGRGRQDHHEFKSRARVCRGRQNDCAPL